MTEPSTGHVFYLDTSALVKRYVAKAGSTWMTGLCNPVTGNEMATELPPPTFIAADDDLLQAAQDEGLLTDNPNLHL